MSTQPINNAASGNGAGKPWTRATIAAAVAAGALTTEAANILYEQLNQVNPDPFPEPSPEPEPIVEPEPIPEPIVEPEPIPEPVPATETGQDNVSHNSSPSAAEQNPNMGSASVYQESDPEIITDVYGLQKIDDSDNIVDIIVEEIDPYDIDMQDILMVDDIGTVYTIEGEELNAALIHDDYGNQALMVDVDGDLVYDVIVTQEGELIAQIDGDVDVSDAELLYAQQHGHSGYIGQNEFDVALNNTEHTDIQSDISLT